MDNALHKLEQHLEHLKKRSEDTTLTTEERFDAVFEIVALKKATGNVDEVPNSLEEQLKNILKLEELIQTIKTVKL
jgi:hypothetical protein